MPEKKTWRDIARISSGLAFACCFVSCTVWLGWRDLREDRRHDDALQRVLTKDLTDFEPCLDFLRRWPQDQERPKVMERLQSLLETQNHVRITVSSFRNFYRHEGSERYLKERVDSLPFKHDAVKLCIYARVRDLAVDIDSGGDTLSARYRSDSVFGSGGPVRELDTGAQLEGMIEMTGPDGAPVVKKHFEGKYFPPTRVEYGSRSHKGPFDEAYRASFLPTFTAIVIDLAGGNSRALIPALRDETEMLRVAVAKEIANRRDPGITGALIGSLREDAAEEFNDGAIRALKDLTEKDFGTDVRAWRAWWRESNSGAGH